MFGGRHCRIRKTLFGSGVCWADKNSKIPVFLHLHTALPCRACSKRDRTGQAGFGFGLAAWPAAVRGRGRVMADTNRLHMPGDSIVLWYFLFSRRSEKLAVEADLAVGRGNFSAALVAAPDPTSGQAHRGSGLFLLHLFCTAWTT